MGNDLVNAMGKYRNSVKDDFKVMYRELDKRVALLDEADPEKLVFFPNKNLMDVMARTDAFRVYLQNPDFETLMILPVVTSVEWHEIASIIVKHSLPTAERGEIPGYFIWLFTDFHLIGCFEIDEAAANLIMLYAAPLNSYDQTQDKEVLADVISEALFELDNEYEDARKVFYP